MRRARKIAVGICVDLAEHATLARQAGRLELASQFEKLLDQRLAKLNESERLSFDTLVGYSDKLREKGAQK